MGNYVAGVVEELTSSLTVKVHVRMCSELLNLVDIVSEAIPEIEAARPRASGMEALSMLIRGISKAKSLLQRCSESSILYLVLTGDDILSRCKKTRNLMEHCLNLIQNTVPVILAAKISGIILALRRADFCLELPEEEAGKLLREILHNYCSRTDSAEDFALSTIHAVCSRLRIFSRTAVVVEARSIKKQLDELVEGKRSKRKILSLFLILLNKYRKITKQGQMDPNGSAARENRLQFVSSHSLSREDSSNSFGSSGSYMNNLSLPSDFSSISFGSSLDTDPSHEICALPLDSSCNAVENIRRLLKISNESRSMMPFGKLIQLLVIFLKDARDLHDVEAQMTGCLYLLELVQIHRNSILHMNEDAYNLLASFLDTEVAKQALSILEALSFHENCGYKIAASGAVVGILNIIESQVQELLEPALNILRNLSANSDIGSFIAPSVLIPKLVPLFETSTLARHCVTILKNSCGKAETGACIAETEGCITSIARLLENGSRVEQEHAASILLALCSQQAQYRQLVVDGGVIPGLVDVSINGSDKAKDTAMELLQILEGKSSRTGERSVRSPYRERNDNS